MARPDDRLRERLDLERPILAGAFPEAVVDTDSLTVTLPDYPLPAGWSHAKTDVLFSFPSNYPAGSPDNVCARPDLRLEGGGVPGNSQGEHVHAGRRWLQLSWHIAEGWHPTADPAQGSNLATYLIGALGRFEEVG